MKVSVIILVYNVADYIERTLDSLFLQTYPDIECIIVNDCTPDNSMAVVEEKLAGYTGDIEFNILHHQTNRGVAAGSNTAISAATGDYIYFLDGDDILPHDAISMLAEPLKNERLDLVIGDFANNVQAISLQPLQLPTGIIRDKQEIIASYLADKWFSMATNKLTRRQFLVDNDISFSEGLLHEDELWSFEVACSAESLGCVNAVTYIYCSRPSSVMNTLDYRRMDTLIRIADEAEAFVTKKHLEDNIDIGRFLMEWREGIGHKAWMYEKHGAYQIYRKHVWRSPALTQIRKRFPELKKIKHCHHALPARIGFCYYMICKFLHRKFSALHTS